MSAGEAQVLVRVGDAESRIVPLRLAGADQLSVTITFRVDGSTVSLTLTADRFLAFVERLQRYAEGLGNLRPS